MTRYHQDIRRHKKLGDKRPTPWPETFRQDVLEAEEKIFITRQPKRVSGGLHPDSLRKHSKRDRERVALMDVKLEDLERLVEKDASNHRLYEHLKQCLEASGDKPTEAFKPPFYVPAKPDTKQRPILSKVTLLKKEKNQQLAEVGDGRLYDSMSQGRLDVYRYRAGGKRNDEYRVVLQRMINLMQGELSNRVFVKGTLLGEGPELDEHYEFLFSLYPDNLVEFRRTNKDDLLIGYYRGFHINKGSLMGSEC